MNPQTSTNGRGGPHGAPQLSLCRADRHAGVTELAVTGEIDMTTGDDFREELARALAEPGIRRLTVDLGPVRFIDSNGVSSLLWAMQVAEEQQVAFCVANATGAARNVLEMLGVYEMLTAAR
jgi:anti-sigma B factor antagonist